MKEFLLGTRGDIVERPDHTAPAATYLAKPGMGAGVAAIVVAAIFLWVSIGQKLAVKLGIVDSVAGG